MKSGGNVINRNVGDAGNRKDTIDDFTRQLDEALHEASEADKVLEISWEFNFRDKNDPEIDADELCRAELEKVIGFHKEGNGDYITIIGIPKGSTDKKYGMTVGPDDRGNLKIYNNLRAYFEMLNDGTEEDPVIYITINLDNQPHLVDIDGCPYGDTCECKCGCNNEDDSNESESEENDGPCESEDEENDENLLDCDHNCEECESNDECPLAFVAELKEFNGGFTKKQKKWLHKQFLVMKHSICGELSWYYRYLLNAITASDSRTTNAFGNINRSIGELSKMVKNIKKKK